MLDYLEHIDRELFLFLNGCHTPLVDSIMWYISTTWLWIPVYLFFLYYAFTKAGWKMVLLLLLGIVCCVTLADLISVHGFKNVFMRYRPTHNLDLADLVNTVNKPNGTEYLGGKYGFVSSHAANIGAIATFVYLQFRKYSKYWLFIFLWGALIMYSRIYMGVHYPSDIVGGAILGASIAFLLHLLNKKLNLINPVS